MRKLILGQWISVDGYAANKNGELDFFPWGEDTRQLDLDQLKFMDSVDTILLGRKTYEIFVAYWPEEGTKEVIGERLNAIPKVVVSSTLKEAAWGKYPKATVVSGDVVRKITKMKNEPGADIILWGSISLAQTLMKANLIDEYHLHVSPALAGGGRRLFAETDSLTKLKLAGFKNYDNGVILLQYKL
jgi:dihydrofolate reductase